MIIGYQNIELMNVSDLETVFRTIGEADIDNNPIEAVFKGFKKIEIISEFIKQQQKNDVFGKISCADEAVKRINVLCMNLINVIYYKSLGLIDFSQDKYDDVIREERDNKKFISTNVILKKDVLGSELIFRSAEIFKEMKETLELFQNTINETFKKQSDYSDKIELQLASSEHLKIGNDSIEKKSMNVYSTITNKKGSIESNRFEDHGSLYRPKEISKEDWKFKVLDPYEKAGEFISILDSTQFVVEKVGLVHLYWEKFGQSLLNPRSGFLSVILRQSSLTKHKRDHGIYQHG